MDSVEERIRLPKGAHPLADYARYYTSDGALVRAVYLIPIENEIRPGEGCEQISADFSSKEVPCDFEKPIADLKAGQRRWVDPGQPLPLVLDGGCSVVNVVFDPSVSEVKEVSCNGEA